METENLNFELVELLARHGIKAAVVDTLVRISTYPGISIESQIRYKKRSGFVVSFLDIYIKFYSQQVVENYCDYGKTIALARANSLENFTLSCLYPFLTCLLDIPLRDLEVQTWLVNGQAYQVYWGDYVVKSIDGIVSDLPPSLLSRMKSLIRNLPLENDYHWISWFAGFPKGQLDTTGFLLDNNVLEEGEHILKTTPWSLAKGYYSIRNFLLLKKCNETGSKPKCSVMDMVEAGMLC
jgi:hypothetical protein